MSGQALPIPACGWSRSDYKRPIHDDPTVRAVTTDGVNLAWSIGTPVAKRFTVTARRISLSEAVSLEAFELAQSYGAGVFLFASDYGQFLNVRFAGPVDIQPHSEKKNCWVATIQLEEAIGTFS